MVHLTDREWAKFAVLVRGLTSTVDAKKGKRAMGTWLSERERRGRGGSIGANADSHPDRFQRRVSAAPAERS